MRSAKRVRSLASKLWGGDSEEDAPYHHGDCVVAHAPQEEAAALRRKVQVLEEQNRRLRETVDELKSKVTDLTVQLYEVQKFVVPLGGRCGSRRSVFTESSWLEDNKHLLELPRMSQFLNQLDSCSLRSDFSFRLCSQDDLTASRILKHCEWVVHNLSKEHPAVYKIGITENVVDRWMGKTYSYKFDTHEHWQGMTVLFVGADSLSCALVESHLISRFVGRAGCRNSSPGGEAAKNGPGPFFTYCVWRSLAPPK